MADKKMELDLEIPGYDKKQKFLSKKFLSKKFNRIFLIASAGVLVAALAVAAVLLLGRPQEVIRIIDFNTAMNGVSVGGIDISGMTRDQAVEATAQLETDMLAAVKVSLSVNGEIYEYGPSELSITTDYTDMVNQAMNYGHTGTIDEREAAAGTPKNFDIKLTADDAALSASLAYLKSTLDTLPRDATAVFTPWGHTADGTPYQPDIQDMIEKSSKRKALEYPEDLVRITDDQMPIELRYQYWENTKYKSDYKPAPANISRFYYTPEQTGLITDTASIKDEISGQVQSGDFSTITVPVQVTEPAVTQDDLKKDTQLITSWTSSYSLHHDSGRVWNVAKMSGIICGVVIAPGETWSINEEAGVRTYAKGWKPASGIYEGGYTDQPGGGVCQISSTTFNAAIRAGLGTQSKHHSIVSGYMPKGLDATISSEGPDLKLTNPYAVPVYIVSYMNSEDRTVTVEIYGLPPVDPDTGAEVIYDFKPGRVTTYGEPVMQEYWDRATLPDGNPLEPGETKVYANNQYGMRVTTYKEYLSLDGNSYKEEVFEKVDVRPINGQTYHNFSDPSLSPTPGPTPTPGPSTSPTPTPGPSTSPSPTPTPSTSS